MSQWKTTTAQGIDIRGKLGAFENHSLCPANIFWLAIGNPRGKNHLSAVFLTPRLVTGLDESRYRRRWSKTQGYCRKVSRMTRERSPSNHICAPHYRSLAYSQDLSYLFHFSLLSITPFPFAFKLTCTLRSWTVPGSLWPQSPCKPVPLPIRTFLP